jgi:hypothetical protein
MEGVGFPAALLVELPNARTLSGAVHIPLDQTTKKRRADGNILLMIHFIVSGIVAFS